MIRRVQPGKVWHSDSVHIPQPIPKHCVCVERAELACRKIKKGIFYSFKKGDYDQYIRPADHPRSAN